MDWYSFLYGSGFCIFCLLFLSVFLHQPRQKINYTLLQTQETLQDPVRWLNVFFMKLTSTHVDYEIMKCLTSEITKQLQKKKPNFVSKFVVTSAQPSQEEPTLGNVRTINNTAQNALQVFFELHYTGQASILLDVTISTGLAGIEDLFSFHIPVEVFLSMLTARFSIDFSNNQRQATLNVGTDLVVQLDVKPHIGENSNQPRYIESISSWVNSVMNSQIAGKSFVLYK